MVLKRIGDLVYTFRFLKLLTTKFEDTEAYKLGLIDKDGKRDKSVKIDTSEKKDSYTSFHKLVFNIKKILNKSGAERLSSYVAALYLIKEEYNVNVKKILEECDISEAEFLSENSKWFILEDGRLAPGIYRVKSDKILNESLDDLVHAKDQIKIINGSPIDTFLGMEIYEAVHLKTHKNVYVTIGEIYK